MTDKVLETRPLIGLMLGDPTGIGPEIACRMIARRAWPAGTRVVVIGDARVLAMGQADAEVDFPVRVHASVEDIDWAAVEAPGGPTPLMKAAFMRLVLGIPLGLPLFRRPSCVVSVPISGWWRGDTRPLPTVTVQWGVPGSPGYAPGGRGAAEILRTESFTSQRHNREKKGLFPAEKTGLSEVATT
jgi:hypothetical protein